MKVKLGKFVPEKFERIEGLRKRQFIKVLIKIVKERRATARAKKADERFLPRLPRYRQYSDEATSDANFCYEVHGVLAAASWRELKRLVKAGSRDEFDLTTFTKTNRLVERILYQALGFESDKDGVRFRLKDRDRTLGLWPIKPEEKQVAKKEKAAAAEETVSKKKKKSSEKAAPAKKSKSEKKDKKSKKATRTRVTDETRFKITKKFEGGVREKCQSTITGNTSYAAIVKRSKKEHSIPEPKVRGYVSWLLNNGYISAS